MMIFLAMEGAGYEPETNNLTKNFIDPFPQQHTQLQSPQPKTLDNRVLLLLLLFTIIIIIIFTVT